MWHKALSYTILRVIWYVKNGKNGMFLFFILNNLVQHFPMKIAKGIIQEMTTTKFSGIQMRAGLM